MMQSAGEPGLRPWHDLFMLCRRGSERVGVSDQGLPISSPTRDPV